MIKMIWKKWTVNFFFILGSRNTAHSSDSDITKNISKKEIMLWFNEDEILEWKPHYENVLYE
jgi:hypothetical protein